jgi:hypothetical protein
LKSWKNSQKRAGYLLVLFGITTQCTSRQRDKFKNNLKFQQNKNMTKEQSIIAAKQFRKDADELLQRMKNHNRNLGQHTDMAADDIWEVCAQHTLSIRDLESCIMRQGMALKYIGNPNPYPNSKDPSNTIVEPTSDGLKM